MRNANGKHRGPIQHTPARFVYGVRVSGATRIDHYPTKLTALGMARDWCISPLRTGPRTSEVLKWRADQPNLTFKVTTFTSPEGHHA